MFRKLRRILSSLILTSSVFVTSSFAMDTWSQLYNNHLLNESRCIGNGGEFSGMTCSGSGFVYNPQKAREAFKAIRDFFEEEYKRTTCVLPLAKGLREKEIYERAKKAIIKFNLEEINIYENHYIAKPYIFFASPHYEMGTFPRSRQKTCITDTNQKKLGLKAVVAKVKDAHPGSDGFTVIGDEYFLEKLIEMK